MLHLPMIVAALSPSADACASVMIGNVQPRRAATVRISARLCGSPPGPA